VLVDSLVHDLRQPLTAVIGGLSSLTPAGKLPEQDRELAVIAQDGASRLLHMVNDLLDVTRLEAGAPVVEAIKMSAAEFIRDGAHLLEVLAQEKKLTLTVDIPADLPPVKGDRERLRRVVTNLVGNAVKFTESGGKISVTATADRAGGLLVVSVSDTGMGIPVEAQRRVFEKFARTDGAPWSGRTSTGLGLYFCKLIVEAQGGKVWVESKVGEGTTFRFTVPLAEDDRQG
jgi:signal transduction histidine kinase